MNKITSNYEINETEFCFSLESVPVKPSSIKVHIPKLMAKIEKVKPKLMKESIDSTIFCNAKPCKIKVSRIMTTQNYITVKPYPNEQPSFEDKAKSGKIATNTKFKVDIPSGDIRQIRLSSKY